MQEVKVLVVDDEPGIRELLVDILSPHGYSVFAAADGASALAIAKREKPEVAFIDIRMPGMGGVELLAHLKSFLKDIRVIIITGHSGDEAVAETLRLGAFACLMKPFSVRDVLEMTEIVRMAA